MSADGNTSKTRNRVINLSLVMISTTITLLILEILLRAVAPHETYQSLVPTEGIYKEHNYGDLFPGIEGNSYYSVNEYGYRSPSYFDESRYGILAIGGSTTNCIGLSNDESWPWILESLLNQSALNHAFTVGNVGVPALNSNHHYFQLKYLQPQYENVRMILMLVGINDFNRTFLSKEFTTEENKHSFNRSFIRLPRDSKSMWYQRTELYMHLRDKYSAFRTSPSKLSPSDLDDMLNAYEAATKKDELPDMSLALDNYEANLREIAQLAKLQGSELVLITQPVLWHDGMTEYEKKITLTGIPIKDGITYTVEAMARGMEIFNNRLKVVADDENVRVIDLASMLPQDISVFFDWCHFNKSGAEKVAQAIYGNLGYLLNDDFSEAESGEKSEPIPN